LKKKYKLIL